MKSKISTQVSSNKNTFRISKVLIIVLVVAITLGLLIGLGYMVWKQGGEIHTPEDNDGAISLCTYDGVVYYGGDSFVATDGCNTCTCESDGQVSCTEKACEDATSSDNTTEIKDSLSYNETITASCANSLDLTVKYPEVVSAEVTQTGELCGVRLNYKSGTMYLEYGGEGKEYMTVEDGSRAIELRSEDNKSIIGLPLSFVSGSGGARYEGGYGLVVDESFCRETKPVNYVEGLPCLSLGLWDEPSSVRVMMTSDAEVDEMIEIQGVFDEIVSRVELRK